MAALGFPMKICQGLRTLEEQQALYAQGRSTKGSVVTYADGVKSKSNHQAQADNYGHAVDCCFLGKDPFNDSLPWAAYGEAGKALGLRWGGDFKSLLDRPHLEML